MAGMVMGVSVLVSELNGLRSDVVEKDELRSVIGGICAITGIAMGASVLVRELKEFKEFQELNELNGSENGMVVKDVLRLGIACHEDCVKDEMGEENGVSNDSDGGPRVLAKSERLEGERCSSNGFNIEAELMSDCESGCGIVRLRICNVESDESRALSGVIAALIESGEPTVATAANRFSGPDDNAVARAMEVRAIASIHGAAMVRLAKFPSDAPPNASSSPARVAFIRLTETPKGENGAKSGEETMCESDVITEGT